jgi:hypothetical protein
MHGRKHETLFDTGKTKQGNEHLQKFIELAPDDPDVAIAKGLMAYQE